MLMHSCTCANTLLDLPHDRYATFLTLAGAVVSDPVVVTNIHGETFTADIDAVDVWPMLTGTNTTQPRRLTPTTEASIFDVAPPPTADGATDGQETKWWKLVNLAGQSQYYEPNQQAIKANDTCLAKCQKDPPQAGRTDALVNGCPVCNLTSPCLYDILNDPGERHNLAPQYPDVVHRLTAELNKSLAWYITPHMTPEELNKTYEKFPDKHWGGYLGPCYKRKGASSTSTTVQVEV